jgi:very-short-patch-repair endonuclease
MLTSHARRLRQGMTDAERVLWYELRDRRFAQLKFRRQVPIDHYVVDFCCLSKRLIIEVDGEQHGEESRRRYDTMRTTYLERQGFRLLRFWNYEVLKPAERDAVFDTIAEAVGVA